MTSLFAPSIGSGKKNNSNREKKYWRQTSKKINTEKKKRKAIKKFIEFVYGWVWLTNFYFEAMFSARKTITSI